METNLEMLQEERNPVTPSPGLLRAQGRSIKRLQWAVAFCFLLLCVLALFTVYLLQGGFPEQREQAQTARYQGTSLRSDTRPKAHLTGIKQGDGSSEDLQWESKLGLAFLEGGMNYSDGSIVIPTEGYYFVYAQLIFRPPKSTCSVDRPILVNISQSNSNYPRPQTLLRGMSYCTKDGGLYQPINLVGLLLLQKGDRLTVQISPFTQVDTSVEHKTFFGAFVV